MQFDRDNEKDEIPSDGTYEVTNTIHREKWKTEKKRGNVSL